MHEIRSRISVWLADLNFFLKEKYENLPKEQLVVGSLSMPLNIALHRWLHPVFVNRRSIWFNQRSQVLLLLLIASSFWLSKILKAESHSLGWPSILFMHPCGPDENYHAKPRAGSTRLPFGCEAWQILMETRKRAEAGELRDKKVRK